ncbi:MAG: peptidase [Crinalium sp.]
MLFQLFLLPFYWLLDNLWQRRLLLAWSLSIGSCLFVIFINTTDFSLLKYINTPPALSRTLPLVRGGLGRGVFNKDEKCCIDFANASLDNNPAFPSLKAHPLPTQLAKWQDINNSGDYFSEIKPTKLGYLVWSEFPVKVYIERPTETDKTSASLRRFEQWVEAALKAVEEWKNYLPLIVVDERENADMIFLRSRPPLQPSINPNTGELQLPRARSAQTNYEFYLKQSVSNSPVLSHKFTILISPDPALAQIQSAARHELGHALGIWGHSSLETDVMYFSQVRNPPPISTRDINTLKRIYQQPTRLGWFIKTK